ncbi:MAG: hypothetical protein HQ564_09735 [Candidatus Saganbacteria bacterium]|nr:hypothetical protein [Candidatus Saganbacteria bacterium]
MFSNRVGPRSGTFLKPNGSSSGGIVALRSPTVTHQLVVERLALAIDEEFSRHLIKLHSFVRQCMPNVRIDLKADFEAKDPGQIEALRDRFFNEDLRPGADLVRLFLDCTFDEEIDAVKRHLAEQVRKQDARLGSCEDFSSLLKVICEVFNRKQFDFRIILYRPENCSDPAITLLLAGFIANFQHTFRSNMHRFLLIGDIERIYEQDRKNTFVSNLTQMFSPPPDYSSEKAAMLKEQAVLLCQMLKTEPAVNIVGEMQTGKTTLIKTLQSLNDRKEIFLLDCRSISRSDLSNRLEARSEPIIVLDEVDMLSRAFLKEILEEYQNFKVIFLSHRPVLDEPRVLRLEEV